MEIATRTSSESTGFGAPVAPARISPNQLVLVRMRELADLTDEAKLPRGGARRTAVWNDLVSTATRTERPVFDLVSRLTASGDVVSARSIPIANAVVVVAQRGRTSAVADSLRGVAEVGSVLTNDMRHLSGITFDGRRSSAAPSPMPLPLDGGAAQATWGVKQIGAPTVWARGNTGAGVTVGVIDSGVDVTHEALRAKYRGTDGSVQHNDYNWFDADSFNTGVFTATPFDDDGHGTHVTGTILGSTPTNAIGVAPDAKFMAARIVYADSIDSTISALDCLQFMLAPTTTDGKNPDPSRGADVINDSWGGESWDEHEAVGAFDALKAAGTLIVNSAGNEGPRKGTLGAPGNYAGHLSIAATDSTDRVTGFSSRGPSDMAPDVLLPNLAAPGESVLSSLPGNRYDRWDGTSMAAPHVTGAVALLLSSHPMATYDEILHALASTAKDIDAPGPDLNAGYGRIDVDAAERALASA